MSDINLCPCKENWMEIKNKNDSLYLLSSKGRLYSFKNGRFVGHIKKDGYIQHGGFFNDKMHRLVYRYFYQINIEKYNRNYNEVDHINTIRNHNCVCNLRIGSHKDNINNSITIKKLSESMKGIPRNEETKKKISESQKGKTKPKNIKCHFCNSILMSINNFKKHHGNGKCLFK